MNRHHCPALGGHGRGRSFAVVLAVNGFGVACVGSATRPPNDSQSEAAVITYWPPPWPRKWYPFIPRATRNGLSVLQTGSPFVFQPCRKVPRRKASQGQAVPSSEAGWRER